MNFGTLDLLRATSTALKRATLGEMADQNEGAVREAYLLLDREDENRDQGDEVFQPLLVWLYNEVDQVIDALIWDEEKRAEFATWAASWIASRTRTSSNIQGAA